MKALKNAVLPSVATMIIARAALALLLAAPFFLVEAVAPVVGEQLYTAVVTMSAPAPGMAQLFYNDGTGISEARSSRLPLREGRSSYEFPVPPGTYGQFRLDPGLTSGRYVVESFVILRPDGSPHAALSIERFVAFQQLSVLERSSTRLVLESPPGSFDPSLLLEPTIAISLPRLPYTVSGLGRTLLLWWVIAFAVVLGLERLAGFFTCRPIVILRRLRAVCRVHPCKSILSTALVATIFATYPLLFAKRSVVSPADGPVPMLYDHAPFVPRGEEFGLEDTRGSDVGAMMWAFVPYTYVQRAAIAGREWPLWMRFNGAGRPLWGQGQTFLMDPLHWLALLSPDLASGWDLKFVAHRFVFALGVGAAALVATGSLLGSVAVTGIAPFIGYFTYRFNHPGAFALTYGPWILVAWFRLARASTWTARSRAAVLLAVASSFLLLAAPPKEAVMMLIGCQITGAFSLFLGSMRPRHLLFGFTAATTAGVASLLLTMPHSLVFLDTLAKARTLHDAPIVHLATEESVQGFVLGNLTPASLQPGVNAIVVAFAVACLSVPVVLRQRPGLAACGLASVGLVALAFGLVPPDWVIRVPLVRNIGHFGVSAMTVLVVPALILAAGGLCAARYFGPVRTAMVGAVLAAASVRLFFTAGGLEGLNRFDQWLAAIALSLSCVAPCVAAAAHRWQERALPVLCIAVLIVAVAALGGLHLETGLAPLDQLLAQPRARVSLRANSPAITRALRSFKEPTRAVGLDTVLFQGTQALYRLEGIGGPDALEQAPYEELLDAGGVDRRWGWLTLIQAEGLERSKPLLDLLNVGIIVARRGQLAPLGAAGEADGDPWIDVATRASPWPRAFFVDGVQLYSTPTDLLELVAKAGRPLAAVQSSDLNAVGLTAHLRDHGRVVVPAADYLLGLNTTAFNLAAPAAGVAVLTESWVPDDFRVSLNGKPAVYFRVNHAFKGVVIPGAGSWKIRFEYRPARWTEAWMGAGAGMLLLVAMGLVALGRPSAVIRWPTPAG